MSRAQSMLDPAGVEAERVAELFWLMLGPAVLLWLALMGAAVYGILVRVRSERVGQWWIVGGGVVLPTLALLVFVGAGLSLMSGLRSGDADFTIAVSGEQFWWRIDYAATDGSPGFQTANELWLPNDARVEVTLEAPDVIHSFWVPALAGKVDMIPGRTNRLMLEPRRNGRYRGQCAEFCGVSHAYMAFEVVVVEPQRFARWRRDQAAAATEPVTTNRRRGRDLFLAAGCGACHTVRGTPASGTIGPDLTHVGSRRMLGAATTANRPEMLAHWIEAVDAVKPGTGMPAFGFLDDVQLAAIAAYLGGLK